MTQDEIFRLCIETVEELRQAVFIPWDTGNMATHGLDYRIEGDDFHIFMNFDEAPYVPYTNEPWIDPKWRGKKNPNEGWWNAWCETFMKRLTTKIKGDLK